MKQIIGRYVTIYIHKNNVHTGEYGCSSYNMYFVFIICLWFYGSANSPRVENPYKIDSIDQ